MEAAVARYRLMGFGAATGRFAAMAISCAARNVPGHVISSGELVCGAGEGRGRGHESDGSDHDGLRVIDELQDFVHSSCLGCPGPLLSTSRARWTEGPRGFPDVSRGVYRGHGMEYSLAGL